MRHPKNTISITQHWKSDRYKKIYSNSKWFDDAEYFNIEDKGDFLIIRKCYMEIPKTALKFSGRKFVFVSELPLGVFDIDMEESNEDELVIYYN